MKEYCIQYIDQKDGAPDCKQVCIAVATSANAAAKEFKIQAQYGRITLITYLGKLDD